MNSNVGVLSKVHWLNESYSQRMTTKEWRECLLNGWDKIVYKGCCRQLVALNLGAGVVQVGKAPKDKEDGDESAT